MFIPERVIFERQALDYPLGDRLYRQFREQGMELGFTGSHNRVTGIPGLARNKRFFRAKRTLVVGLRRSQEFATCRPSAHYQLPLATGCPGLCEYCYLLTNLSNSPYIRIYANLKEILEQAADHIRNRLPETTVFEGAATSDPLAVEPYSGSLARTIEFFAGQSQGRFRFVTKFDDVDSLLSLQHGGATRFRFSVNSEQVIRRFEHGTPALAQRLAAARKVAEAGYPLGFMIAPIIASGNPGAERATVSGENTGEDAGGDSESAGGNNGGGTHRNAGGNACGSSGGGSGMGSVSLETAARQSSEEIRCEAPSTETDGAGCKTCRKLPAYNAANWEQEYEELFRQLAAFDQAPDLTCELITHRFTARAKCAIQELFPRSRLPLEEAERRFRWGQFGYGKYVFKPELHQRVEAFFRSSLATYLPHARLEYFV